MNQITELLCGVKNVALIGHIRPDGDCVGSCLGLKNYLNDTVPQLTVDIYLEPFSSFYSILSGAERICHAFPADQAYDLCIVLDASDRERLGAGAALFDRAKKTAVIDHHITNTHYADVCHVCPEVSSTCEVLFFLFQEENISRETAACLYMGIVHDTGVFKHQNTTSRTMNAAGVLIAKGIPFSKIIDETFYKKTYLQNQILGKALMESALFLDGRCIYTVVTKKDMEFYGIESYDLDGIVDQLRITDGVEAAVFLHEIQPQVYKVSMRSKCYVDVSKIVTRYGGGGHIHAAGCTMQGTVRSILERLSLQLEEQLKERGR